MGNSKTISRKELYEAVWAKPLASLAAEWKTTIQQLGEACAIMEVPQPEPRYWQALAKGGKQDPEPLPEAPRVAEHRTIHCKGSPQGSEAAQSNSSSPTNKQPGPRPAAASSESEHPRTADHLAELAQNAVLDLIRQATKLDFWVPAITEKQTRCSLAAWFRPGGERKPTEAQLVKALKSTAKKYRTFEVRVQETRARNQWNQDEFEITIALNDGCEWLDAGEEAWSFAQKPNEHFLSDNAALLYAWAKSDKNTGKFIPERKIGAQARLRKTYYWIEQHLQEIQLKAEPKLQWERNREKSTLRVWFEARAPGRYYHYGPLNPALKLDVLHPTMEDFEKFRNWFHGEVLKPGFPDSDQVVGIFHLHRRRDALSAFDRPPADRFNNYDPLADFFEAARLVEGIELKWDFEDDGGPWLVTAEPQQNLSWADIKARLKAKDDEIPLEKKYQLTPEALALLRWILDLHQDEFLQGLTPVVEPRVEKEIGIQKEWDSDNWRAYLEVLIEEINEQTEFKLRAIPWQMQGGRGTRILVKRKLPTIESLVLGIQQLALAKHRTVAADVVRQRIDDLINAPPKSLA